MSKPPWLVSGLILAWLLAAGLGFVTLGAYHARPGKPGSPLDRWPSGTLIPLDSSRPTLLIFIHPRCPCSSASLAELGQVASRFRGRIAAQLMAFQPDGEERPEWGLSANLASVTFRPDRGGREALRFGVETSGHVLLFDPSGQRLFSGGITISRGHRGDNPGLDGLLATILGESPRPGPSPVFGCPILTPTGRKPRPDP